MRRTSIRLTYRPSIVDVVASLLSDIQCTDGYLDWVDWANDMGLFSDKVTPDSIRKAIADFATIKERAPTLRTMLGADYEKALDCVGRL